MIAVYYIYKLRQRTFGISQNVMNGFIYKIYRSWYNVYDISKKDFNISGTSSYSYNNYIEA